MPQRPDDDVPGKQRGQQQAGYDPGDEEMGDRDVGGDAIDDHDDRRRDQQAERAGAGQRADGDVLGIAAALQLRQRHLADGRARRGGRAGDRGEDGAADDVGVEQPPGTRSSQGARPRNMSSDRRVRNRISPIQTKSGSAVSVQLEDVPQMVTAIASPAGRAEKTSMPIHATPASAMPIHTPLPSSTNSDTMRSAVIRRSTASPIRCARALRSGFGASPCRSARHEMVDEGDRQHDGAGRHRKLRNPQRRRVVAGRDVVEMIRLPREAQAEPGKG